ncbi:porin [Acidithiobacillus caldus]|uniref:porin n=1 Tax=Acidithiobacillus caldus TaxID=33059 RepID=UPI001C071283|nr:porin [Acidithiobacillus caldus]MBU2734731.1 porin [Acidithiobacillus caldus ATCC 51756]MBU2764228.1 porin [Acidithiobacillus caldus]MBU2770329.1 porin [Acidithiobacillus caldus]
MKKNLVAFAVAAAVLVPGVALAADSSNADTGPVLYGYAQITGSNQFGTHGPEGLIFGAHRIRLGVKGEAVPGVSYNFQYKWDGAWMSGGSLAGAASAFPGVDGQSGVQEAEINFGFVPALQLEVGKFRVPVGLERTQFSGNNLWFIQRSMNQSLGADRSVGAAFHSPNVMGTGIYYKIGIFDNHSLDGSNAFSDFGTNALNAKNVGYPFGSGQTRVGGVLTNGSGKYLFAGMLGYKMSPLLNVELSGARADTNLSGPGYANQIDAWNLGVNGGLMGIKYMAEYSRVNSYGGIEGLRGSDWYVALAANLHEMTLTPDWLDIEPAVRFERFDYRGTVGSGVPGNINGAYLNNTTIGVNYYVNPNNPHAAEVQLNYIVPTGASGYRAQLAAGKNYAPANAYLYNTLALQFQAGF